MAGTARASPRASSTTVRGRKVLVVTGRFGFKTLTSAIRRTRSCSTSSCRRDRPGGDPPPAGRLLAERGHGARHAAQADHRRARSAAQRRRPAPTAPCPHNDSTGRTRRRLQSGFFVISYADPSNMRADRRLRRACRRATRRAASRTASTSGPAARRGDSDQDWLDPIIRSEQARADHAPEPPDRRRPADLGHRPDVTRRTRGSPTSRSTSSATTATPTTRTTSTRTRAASRGSAGRGGIRGYATRGRHRDPYQNRVRQATPFDPILVAGGGLSGTSRPPERNDGVRRPPTSCTTPAVRPTARSGRRA